MGVQRFRRCAGQCDALAGSPAPMPALLVLAFATAGRVADDGSFAATTAHDSASPRTFRTEPMPRPSSTVRMTVWTSYFIEIRADDKQRKMEFQALFSRIATSFCRAMRDALADRQFVPCFLYCYVPFKGVSSTHRVILVR